MNKKNTSELVKTTTATRGAHENYDDKNGGGEETAAAKGNKS